MLATNRQRRVDVTQCRKVARAGRLLAYLSLLAGVSCAAFAQGTQSVANTGTASADQFLNSYEGQTVSAVQIAGRADDITTKYAGSLTQKAGEPFSKDKVKQSAAALKAAGNFEQVQVQVIAESSGVRVLFVIEPALYFGIFQFSGTKQLSYAQLIQATNYPIQTPFNPAEVNADRDSLLTFLRQQGFFRAEVEPQVSVDSAHALANVDFQTTLGKRAKFGKTVVEGAPDSEDSKLENKATSFRARLRGAAIRSGKTYRRGTLTRSANYLQRSLEKEGYLGASVKLSGAEYQAETNRADIHFHVDPGEITHVQIDGAHLWPWTRKALLPVYQGVGVNDETVLEGQQAIVNHFQAKGYFDVKVESNRVNGSNGEQITYRITKNKKHKVESVQLTGQSEMPASQLTPLIAVKKEHFLSSGKFSDDLLNASVKNLRTLYQSEGYSSVQVTSTVKRDGGNVEVAFRVMEGPRDIVNSLKVEGANTLPQGVYAPNGFSLAEGQPYSQSHLRTDRSSIISQYLKAGYLRASFRETASEVSKTEPHRINVVYHIDEGPRVVTGEVITLGRGHTLPRVFSNDLKAIRTGQPLTESDLLAAGSKLYEHTGVFDWAEVDPKEPIGANPKNDVLVKVHEGKRNEITYGFGFEVIRRGGSIPSGTVALPNLPPIGLPKDFTTSEATFYGPRGTFQFTRNNLRGKAESLSLTGFAGRLDQRAALFYIDPNFRWTSWKATTSALFERNEQNPIFSSQQVQGTFQVQRAINRSGYDLLFFQYGYNKVNITHVLIEDLVPQRDRNLHLSTVSGNLTRDTRDNAVDAHKGVLRSLELDFNTKALGSSVNFAKLTGQAAFYREKIHHIVWADSIRVGLAQPFGSSFVPLSESFFSGGGNSLRGIPLNGAGPQKSVEVCSNGASHCNVFISVPSGGNELLLLNSEARIPLPVKKDLSLVTFYDGGGVFPYVGFNDFTQHYTNNVGLGLRYATPVGPIRVDIGHNFNPVPGAKSFEYFIGIGQAF
jgi:outer membrane protein insertion porin family